MRIKAKILGFLIISFFLVSIFLGTVSIYSLFKSQGESLVVSKNELLEISRESTQEGADFFFRFFEEKLQNNPTLSAQDVLKIVSDTYPAYRKNIVAVDIKQKNAISGYDKSEIVALADRRTIDRYLDEMILTRKNDFYLDNYREFTNDKKGSVIPAAAYFRIYDNYNLIIGYGKAMDTAKLRIEFMKKKNRDYFYLYLLFTLFIYAGVTAVAVFISMRFMRRWFVVPLKEIGSGVEKVEKGNLKTVIPVRSKDEIGDLASSFNQMTRTLQTTTTSIDNLNKEITERKRTEEALRENEVYLTVILDSIPVGMVLIDPETHIIVEVNSAAIKLIGVDKDMIVGKVCHKFICPAEEGKCPITDLDQSVDNSERLLLTVSGEKIPILKTVISVTLKGHRYLLESFMNITERKKAEMEREILVKELEERQESLEYVNKELDDFTYTVSHDLKEPLRTIDAFSKYVMDDYKDRIDEQGKHYLERIRANAERMKELIEDLLEISRIKKKGSTIEEVEIQELIDEVKMRLEYAINQKSVEIVIKDKLPKIFCDKVRLNEVFLNLISNAIKFNDKPNPVIEVGCNSKGDFYEFYIKDNGMGIQEEYFNKIFDIFQRLGKREDVEGTGAGLTIVKKIVEMHKGKIWLESKVGEGTTFYFTVPKSKNVILGKKLIGDILLEKALISEEDLKKALEEQRRISNLNRGE